RCIRGEGYGRESVATGRSAPRSLFALTTPRRRGHLPSLTPFAAFLKSMMRNIVMPDVTLAGEIKDWLTSVAIVVGGGWAMWRFGHAEWLRRRAEIPSLEGNANIPEICA